MDTTPLYLVGALLLSTLLFLFLFSGRRRNLLLPPTISGAVPILGHLHLIIGARRRHQPLHHALAALSADHGPILLLRFGSRQVLYISSPSAAEDCLTINDITFSNRPHLLAGKYLNFDNSSLATASYSPHWRNLRRIAAAELFSSARIQSLANFRAEGIRSLLSSLLSAAAAVNGTAEWSQVEMKRKFKMLTFSTIMRILDGRKYCGEENTANSEMGERMMRMTDEGLSLSDASSLEDFVPWMGWLGIAGGTKRRMIRLGKEMNEIFQEMVDERRRRRTVKAVAAGADKTIVDVMLALQEQDPENYSDKIIKGMISAIIIAGTETTAGLMEWALSLLLNHPKTLQKARDEIDSHIGGGGGHGRRLITDSDLPHLPHLQNIIKETLRLFPPGPLLLPHQSSADCTVAGYTIPSGTMLLINAYAIHRDPALWKDAGSFMPERFAEGEGEGFHFLPFGWGRRRCPGEGLAYRLMGLAVGALIQCFEWKRVNGEETVDLTEGPGLSMPKLVPLEALYKPREVMLPVLSQL
ncbi:Cytochrome P450 81D1 [Platanthera zijinensis]|uniref:Cytochrome P450 81D1 n=1 Tax=Platanthera zijinensis TaxID=2320716 RepID=A0AAP0FYD1_9ASPA